jgi:chitinase
MVAHSAHRFSPQHVRLSNMDCPRAHRCKSGRAIVACLLLIVCASEVALALPHLGSRREPRLLIGYFNNSSFYSPTPFYVKNLLTSGSAARLNQINYASASIKNGRCSLADPPSDLQATYNAQNSVDGRPDNPDAAFRGYFHQLEELKRKYPRIRILISLEGRATDFAIDAKPENRVAFVSSCVNMYLRGEFADGVKKPRIFDGIDVDWESPQQEDAANYHALLAEFRRQMDAVRPGLTLSIAVNESPSAFAGTDFAALAPLVDQVGIMNYDYAGPWSGKTGFLAPLFPASTGLEQAASIQRSISNYKAAGIPARKLLMGVPFYGYGWTGVDRLNNGLFQTGRAMRGDRPYHLIRSLALSSQVFRDQRSQAPWLFNGQDFWTYEDPTSIKYKVSYAARQGIGGVMIWELSGDTADGELLNSAWRALRQPLRQRVFDEALAATPGASQSIGGQ